MLHRLRMLFRDRLGTTAVEYGLIATLISIAIIAVLMTIGDTITTQFFGPIASNL